MAASSPAEVPRGLAFLLSLNRLNVAVSRARALSVLVASPQLVAPSCRTLEEMRLANALCRYVELAETVVLPEGRRAAPHRVQPDSGAWPPCLG